MGAPAELGDQDRRHHLLAAIAFVFSRGLDRDRDHQFPFSVLERRKEMVSSDRSVPSKGDVSRVFSTPSVIEGLLAGVGVASCTGCARSPTVAHSSFNVDAIAQLSPVTGARPDRRLRRPTGSPVSSRPSRASRQDPVSAAPEETRGLVPPRGEAVARFRRARLLTWTRNACCSREERGIMPTPEKLATGRHRRHRKGRRPRRGRGPGRRRRPVPRRCAPSDLISVTDARHVTSSLHGIRVVADLMLGRMELATHPLPARRHAPAP